MARSPHAFVKNVLPLLKGRTMQFALTSEHTMIVDTVRAFVEKELYPHEDLVERTDAIPPELVQSIQAKAIEVGLYAANMLSLIHISEPTRPY